MNYNKIIRLGQRLGPVERGRLRPVMLLERGSGTGVGAGVSTRLSAGGFDSGGQGVAEVPRGALGQSHLAEAVEKSGVMEQSAKRK